MAFQLTVLYNHPADPQAFDAYYDGTHAPLAAKFPTLRSFTINRPTPGPDGAQPAYHLIAVLVWDSQEDFGADLGSDIGKEIVGDVENFGQAGVTMLTGAVDTVV